MQYLPQQPTNQPYYPPSEVYMPERPQISTPLPVYAPSDQSSTADQGIAIYYNQKLLTPYTRVCKVLLGVIIAVVLFFGLLALLSIFPVISNALGTPIERSDILPMVISFMILLAVIVFFARWTRLISSLSAPDRKPILHITHQGITIQHIAMIKYRFLPWNEIETLYVSKVLLKIRSTASVPSSLHNPEQSQKRVSKSTRISLIYLDTPHQEILQQILQTYANELSRYNIQFRP